MIINLLPSNEKKQLRRRYHARVVLVAAILSAIVVLFSTLALLSPLLRLRYEMIAPAHERQAVQNASTPGGAATTTTLVAIDDEVRAVNAKIAIINNATPGEVMTKESVLIARIIDALGRASTASHAKITITGWHLVEQAGDPTQKIPPSDSISLSGITENRQVLFAFTKELTHTQGIVSVDNPITNYIPGKNGDYAISVVAE